ncbi:hypothetical protein BSLA_01f5036 [Burkholderia stabilis]|nr:hypothetical protein BSLA_01f5036 [Burkholderia stabilis]
MRRAFPVRQPFRAARRHRPRRRSNARFTPVRPPAARPFTADF